MERKGTNDERVHVQALKQEMVKAIHTYFELPKNKIPMGDTCHQVFVQTTGSNIIRHTVCVCVCV